VVSRPLSLKQARPYQVISMGPRMVADAGDSTSAGARPMTPALEGGRVEVETRLDLQLAG
jgi:hypothetical protein